MKINPVEAELFHANGRTDEQTVRQTDRHDEANSRLSQFCEHAYKRTKAASILHNLGCDTDSVLQKRTSSWEQARNIWFWSSLPDHASNRLSNFYLCAGNKKKSGSFNVTYGPEFQSWQRQKDFFLLQNIQTSSGAHPAPCSIQCRGHFPGIKRPGHELDHSPSPSVQVKHEWSYTSTPLYVYNAWTKKTLHRSPVSYFGNSGHSDSGLFFSVSAHKMWAV